MLQVFVEATASLRSIYETSPASFQDNHAFQATLLEMDNELPGIHLMGESLNKGKAILAGMRNRSTKLVPISSLPAEVLGHIFTLLPSRCLLDNIPPEKKLPPYPDILVQVSTNWSRVALETLSLWSHIDILACDPHSTNNYSMARHWLERAKGAPLHVHISAHHR